jgi:dipeptidyl-peptidase-4
MIFSAASSARDIRLEDLSDKTMMKKDEVERFFAGPRLIEKHSDPAKKEWVLKFITLESNDFMQSDIYPSEEIRSSQVLRSFQRLVGMENISFEAIKNYTISPDLSRLLFYFSNDLFLFSRDNGEVERITSSLLEKEEFHFSPDGQLIAYLEGHNLWVVDVRTKEARKLSFDGTENLLYGKLDWVYQEEVFGRGDFKAFWWSPDSQNIAFLRINESPVKKFPLEDDAEDYGNLRLMSYPKAGTDNPVVDIGIVNARGGDIIWVDLSPYQSITPLIVGLGFNKDGSQLLYQVQNRTQSWLDLRSHDMSNSQSTTIWTEESTTWVNRLQESPVFNDEGFYFLSERSGFAHIYYYSYAQKNAHQITNKVFEVKEICSVTNDYIYFVANEENLAEDQLFSLNLQNGEINRLLMPKEHHKVLISEDSRFLLATSQSYLLPSQKTLYALRGSTAKPMKSLFRADISKLQKLSLQKKNYLTIENRRGQKMQSVLFLPTNLDPNKKYPVMTHVYCGPKNPAVKNRFSLSFELWHHYLAQEGYIVFMMDCHSANSIGHDGESIVYKKLGVSELEDIEDGISFIKKYPWVDSQRIALWGWSYGGYMTSFAMTRTNLFKMGIAVAPVSDWRLYDTIYTERYMCTPADNEAGYRCSSVLEHAADLSGELLLVHGLMDDNVHKQHSLRFIHKAQLSSKTVHPLLYLQNDHGLLDVRASLFRNMEKFIRENL